MEHIIYLFYLIIVNMVEDDYNIDNQPSVICIICNSLLRR